MGTPERVTVVSISMPPSLLARLKRLALAEGRSTSAFIAYHLSKRFPTAKRPATPPQTP